MRLEAQDRGGGVWVQELGADREAGDGSLRTGSGPVVVLDEVIRSSVPGKVPRFGARAHV